MSDVILISGATSSLGKEFVKQNKNSAIVAIGRHLPKADIPFFQFDFSKRVTEKDFSFLDEYMKDKNIKAFVWMAGFFKRVSLSEIKPEDMENNLYLDVINPLTICSRYETQIRNGKASLVFVSSLLTHRFNSDNIPYSVSKSAQVAMMKNIALNLGKYDVRANSVSPSLFKSNMSQSVFKDKEKIAKLLEHVPLHRLPTAKSVVKTINFLISDNSRDITGQEFIIDCGNLLCF